MSFAAALLILVFVSLSSSKEPSFLSRFLGFWSAADRLRREKARLEAFLSAVPGAYCGWAADRSVAYSQGFCDSLGIKEIRAIADIQTALVPGDAAALEGFFDRLRRRGTPFTLNVKHHKDKKIFKISGSRGEDISGKDRFDVLWIEDVTPQIEARESEQKKEEEERSRSENFKAALTLLPRPLWMRDKAQNLIWCNEEYTKILGLSPKTVLKEQKELTAPPKGKKSKDDKEPSAGAKLAAKALQAGESQIMQEHVISQGKRRYMRILETPARGHNVTLGMALDITREEEIETEMKRRREATRTLMEGLRTAIGIFGADERLEFYNTAYAQLWGLEDGWLNTHPKLGEIMEKLRETRRLPEQADFRRFKKIWLDMFTDLMGPHDEMLYLPDGSVLRMLVLPHALGGLMMTFEDVTSRLELESSYNTLLAVQKETLDNLGEAVAVYGGDGRLKLWNPAFGRLWGLHPEDLEGHPHITSLVDKMKPYFAEERWSKQREDLISKGLDRIMHEGRLTCANGTLLDFNTVPLPDGGVLITYINVTDTVRVENALREKNAALEAAEQLKLDFLANVSYQLRTPLNAIMGFTEILDQEYFGPLNDRQKEYTHGMQEASARLLGLINDILDLSGIEAGYLELETRPIKIHALLENMANLMAEWARKKQIKVELNCAKNIGSLEGDEARLKQALVNLIRNAISFTPEGGKIILSAKRRKDGIEIGVSDTGIGISPEDQKRIFEPFERSRFGKESSKGAGLGLSLVKNIATLHHGAISIDSKPGEGSSFTLFIPFEKDVKIEESFQKQASF